MQDVRINATLSFDPKHYDTIVKNCEKHASDSREHAGMLEYSFWANDARDTIYVLEHYESVVALDGHLQKLDQAAARSTLELAKLAPLEVCYGGEPDPLLVQTLNNFGVPINFYGPVASR